MPLSHTQLKIHAMGSETKNRVLVHQDSDDDKNSRSDAKTENQQDAGSPQTRTSPTKGQFLFGQNGGQRLSFRTQHDLLHADILHKMENIKRSKRWIINPVSKGMKRWDVLMIVLLLFTACATPYEVSFLEPALDALFIINRIVDFAFMLDMCLHFFLPFETPEGQTVYKHSKIAKHYLETWFLIDFVSIIPFDIFGLTMNSDSASQLRMLRMVRLLRLLKLLRVVKASRILGRWESQLGISFAELALVKWLFFLVILLHWGACLWNLAAVLEDGGMLVSEEINPHTWLEVEGVENATAALQYTYCLHFSVSILFSGEGAISPVTATERGFTIVLIILGGSIYAYVIGTVCGIVSSMDLATKMFEQSMDNLNQYLSENKFPSPMRAKMRQFFLRAKGLHRSKFYRETLAMVSPELRKQMSAHVHGVWMDQVEFLRDVPSVEKANFSAAVAMVLVTEIFAPGEDIIKRGELTEKMYIIQKGLVARLGRVFGKGRYVGEDMILHSCRRHYYVRTLTFVDCQSLSKESLEGITNNGDFPVSKHSIRHSAIRLCLQRTIVSAARTVKGMFAFGNAQMKSELDLDFKSIVQLGNDADQIYDADNMTEDVAQKELEHIRNVRRSSTGEADTDAVTSMVLDDAVRNESSGGAGHGAGTSKVGEIAQQQSHLAQQIGSCQSTLRMQLTAQSTAEQRLQSIKRQLKEALAAERGNFSE